MVGEANIAAVGSLLADRARARVLLALADGRSLPATMLAAEAGVSRSTASHHLGRLLDFGLVRVESIGRYRYFALAGKDVADLIEAAARIAPLEPVTSLRQGTRAHAIRYARSCYDHLAGRLGVAVANSLCDDRFCLTDDGVDRLARLDIPAGVGDQARACGDWTERRDHIAWELGRRLLHHMLEHDWLVRDRKSRAVRVTPQGAVELPQRLGIQLP